MREGKPPQRWRGHCASVQRELKLKFELSGDAAITGVMQSSKIIDADKPDEHPNRGRLTPLPQERIQRNFD
jgi:hypothetical protein